MATESYDPTKHPSQWGFFRAIEEQKKLLDSGKGLSDEFLKKSFYGTFAAAFAESPRWIDAMRHLHQRSDARPTTYEQHIVNVCVATLQLKDYNALKPLKIDTAMKMCRAYAREDLVQPEAFAQMKGYALLEAYLEHRPEQPPVTYALDAHLRLDVLTSLKSCCKEAFQGDMRILNLLVAKHLDWLMEDIPVAFRFVCQSTVLGECRAGLVGLYGKRKSH